MHRNLVFCFFLSFLFFACPADFKDFAVKVEEKTLSNGLKFIQAESLDQKSAAITLVFAAGVLNDLSGQSGASYLLSQYWETKYESIKMELGFPSEFHTNSLQDSTLMTLEVDSKNLKEATRFLTKILVHKKDPIYWLKFAQLETIRDFTNKVTESDFLARSLLWKLRYSDHPYAKPGIGLPQDTININFDELLAFQNSLLTTQTVHFVVVSGTKNSNQEIEQILSQLTLSRRLPKPIPPPEIPKSKTEVLKTFYPGHSLIYRAYPLPSGHSEDLYALDLLNEALFNTQDGLIFKLDSEKILASVNSLALTPKNEGIFWIQVFGNSGIPKEKLEKLIDLTLEKSKKQKLSLKSLQNAKQNLFNSFYQETETPTNLAEFIGIMTTISGQSKRFIRDFTRYQLVRPDEIQKVAQKYFKKENEVNLILDGDQK